MMVRSAIMASLIASPAFADCASVEDAFLSFLTDRYGNESSEATIFADGPTADRWGIAASMYISASDHLLRHAIPGRIPFILLDELGDPDDLAKTAEVALMAEDAALCLRPTGTPMIIGDRDMGAQFDETHNEVLREEIRTFAEGLL